MDSVESGTPHNPNIGSYLFNFREILVCFCVLPLSPKKYHSLSYTNTYYIIFFIILLYNIMCKFVSMIDDVI